MSSTIAHTTTTSAQTTTITATYTPCFLAVELHARSKQKLAP